MPQVAARLAGSVVVDWLLTGAAVSVYGGSSAARFVYAGGDIGWAPVLCWPEKHTKLKKFNSIHRSYLLSSFF